MTLLGSLFFLRDFPAVPTMLTIAGSDSCGGAGIEADIKTATVLGVFSACCITAVTYQNTRGVAGLEMVSEVGLKEQLKAVCTDMTINAVKIGMTGSKETIRTIRDAIVEYGLKNVVLDPVMAASSGQKLTKSDVCGFLKEFLIPVCALVTPNLPEVGVKEANEV